MLIASSGISQEDTVKLPFSVAKKVALDLEELDRLKAVDKVNTLELAKYAQLTEGLQQISKDKSLQINLLQRSVELWKSQYEAEKAKKPKNTVWEKIGIGAGAFLLGFFVASVK